VDTDAGPSEVSRAPQDSDAEDEEKVITPENDEDEEIAGRKDTFQQSKTPKAPAWTEFHLTQTIVFANYVMRPPTIQSVDVNTSADYADSWKASTQLPTGLPIRARKVNVRRDDGPLFLDLRASKM